MLAMRDDERLDAAETEAVMTYDPRERAVELAKKLALPANAERILTDELIAAFNAGADKHDAAFAEYAKIAQGLGRN
jgi:hypothetical protein